MMLDRIVEVFCAVDDFCKAFLPQWEASLLSTGGTAPRGPEPSLSTSEIITLLLVLHSSGFKYLKSFYHGFAEPLLRGSFPGMPLKDPLIFRQCIQPRDIAVLLNRDSYVEQYDRRTETRVHAVSGCQGLS
jgi:hypothetical protein